jgi:hypothetical protein
MKITDSGINFIVEEETGGKDYYEKVYKSSFIWPEGASGCTAMVGVDIGYYTVEEVNTIFRPLSSEEELQRIQGGRGIKGEAAAAYVKKLKDIKFTWDEAIATFKQYILPKFTNLTERAFPGVEKLCPGAQTALVSLVFNRGTAMKGKSRVEMLKIRQLVQERDYEAMVEQIRAMKRLWSKTSGLVGRREREAKLVEECFNK